MEPCSIKRIKPPEQGQDEHRRANDKDLARFDAQVERQQRHGDFTLRQSDFGQSTCKAKAMQQSKEEGDNPRDTFRKARRSRVAFNNLNR